LLFVTTVQVSHSCNFQSSLVGSKAGSASASDGAKCQICLMSQTAAPALAIVFTASPYLAAHLVLPQVLAGESAAIFHFYVRPPPAS